MEKMNLKKKDKLKTDPHQLLLVIYGNIIEQID